MSRPRTRPLFLHTSALSDAEYTVYVEALCDILEDIEPGDAGGDNAKLTDEELEARMVGMREARAWMRGRYRDVSVSDIDKVRLCLNSGTLKAHTDEAIRLAVRYALCALEQ